MRGKIGALVAAVAAAASAAGAAGWARRRRRGAELDLEVGSSPGAQGTTAARRGEDETGPVEATPMELPAAPEPAAAVSAPQPSGDDLTAIKGLGKVKVAKLAGMGITTYAQIAAWTDDDIAEAGLAVNTSPGQIRREDWVGQAKTLAGD